MDNNKLNENRNLILCLCQLPINPEELQALGMTEEEINCIGEFYNKINPIAIDFKERIKEIITKVETGKTLFQGK